MILNFVEHPGRIPYTHGCPRGRIQMIFGPGHLNTFECPHCHEHIRYVAPISLERTFERRDRPVQNAADLPEADMSPCQMFLEAALGIAALSAALFVGLAVVRK